MLLYYVSALLSSFFLTFVLSIPYIKLLYKFNIRRISKVDLDEALPGRQVKLGTPIMGGGVILFSVIFLLIVFLNKWEFTSMIILVLIFGGIAGGIDEYTNTLGRTIKAIRISKSHNGIFSFFPVSAILLPIKRALLIPWRGFEEILRKMGSEQRGLKSHYKLLMHIAVAMVVIVFFYFYKVDTRIYFIHGFEIDFSYLYYLILIGGLLFMANAFGITDGMDGLSAGTHTVSFIIYGVLSSYLGYSDLAIFCFILAGAELAFLYFNIYPARMEMSDVGTVPLGMLLVVVAFLSQKELALLFISGLYIIEILSSLIQVWAVVNLKRKLFLVAPIHHHFEKLGWPETKVTTRFWLFNAILGLVGLFIALV